MTISKRHERVLAIYAGEAKSGIVSCHIGAAFDC
jgi:hypothetical protein